MNGSHYNELSHNTDTHILGYSWFLFNEYPRIDQSGLYTEKNLGFLKQKMLFETNYFQKRPANWKNLPILYSEFHFSVIENVLVKHLLHFCEMFYNRFGRLKFPKVNMFLPLPLSHTRRTCALLCMFSICVHGFCEQSV